MTISKKNKRPILLRENIPVGMIETHWSIFCFTPFDASLMEDTPQKAKLLVVSICNSFIDSSERFFENGVSKQDESRFLLPRYLCSKKTYCWWYRNLANQFNSGIYLTISRMQPRSLTWNMKMMVAKGNLLFQGWFSGSMLNFRGVCLFPWCRKSSLRVNGGSGHHTSR